MTYLLFNPVAELKKSSARPSSPNGAALSRGRSRRRSRRCRQRMPSCAQSVPNRMDKPCRQNLEKDRESSRAAALAFRCNAKLSEARCFLALASEPMTHSTALHHHRTRRPLQGRVGQDDRPFGSLHDARELLHPGESACAPTAPGAGAGSRANGPGPAPATARPRMLLPRAVGRHRTKR